MDIEENESNKSISLQKKYSKQLVDRIADKLAHDLSLKEICNTYDWAPHYNTARAWEINDEYTRQRFSDARTTGLESVRKDRLTELKHTDFTKIAEDVDKLLLKTPGLKEKLFQVKAAHIYKEIDQIYKELSIEAPKKYGTKIQVEENFGEKAKMMTLSELLPILQQLSQDPKIHLLIDANKEDQTDVS